MIGGHPVAALSFDYWTGRFNSDPRIVGRKILLNGQPFTIIGVSRRGFHGIDIGYATQVFVPMMMKPQMTPGWNFLDERRSRFARGFARLRSGVTAERAEAGLQPFFRAMHQEEMKDPSFTTASAYAKREFMRASLKVVPSLVVAQVASSATVTRHPEPRVLTPAPARSNTSRHSCFANG